MNMVKLLLLGVFLLATPSWASGEDDPQFKNIRNTSKLDLIEVRTWVDRGGMENVLVEAESRSRFDKKVRYRVSWYSANGEPFKTIMSRWQNRTLPPKGSLEISSVAPHARAVAYKVEIEDL